VEGSVDIKVRMSWAHITPQTKKYVANVLDRGWLSYSLYMPRFEKTVAEIHGAKFGVMMNSGTDALRIGLATLKEIYKWPDQSEVLVPALTFVATVNAILQSRLKPIFVDVQKESANMDATRLSTSGKSVALMPVHLFGLPADLNAIKDVAGKRKILEDSCETFGVHGLRGDMAAFSFYMSHHVSAGVGGMLLTNSPKYAQIARSYMNHGRIDDGSHFQFGRSGYSSRATEMEAAVGLAALEHFESDLKKRNNLATWYSIELCEYMDRLQLPVPVNSRHSWMFFPLRLKRPGRDKLLQYLRKHEIESREAMPLINQPVFKKLYKRGSCPVAENWTQNGILLPLHPQMSREDVLYVCEKVRKFLK